MNYSNHNLRTNLQEWKNRLYKAPFSQFGYQIKFFLNNLQSNKQINGLLSEISNRYSYDEIELEKIIEQLSSRKEFEFTSPEHQAAFCFQFLNYFTKKNSYELSRYYLVSGSNFEDKKKNIIEVFFAPILYFLHDKLDKSNSIIYLLEKYKKRTEWFTKKKLFESYKKATKNYEQILEDDLRLFLFDQGIEYPFSTPASASGRADLIGEIDTDDPLVAEVKIFDREKGYGKDRIKDGFSQILKYSNDYNKDVGYLIIFNMDNAVLNLNFNKNDNIFPPSIQFNNKMFYFIIVNSADLTSASKTGTTNEIEITESEMTKK